METVQTEKERVEAFNIKDAQQKSTLKHQTPVRCPYCMADAKTLENIEFEASPTRGEHWLEVTACCKACRVSFEIKRLVGYNKEQY